VRGDQARQDRIDCLSYRSYIIAMIGSALRLDLGFLLSSTARVMRRVMDQRAAQLGLTRAQWTVLIALKREEGRRQIDLARDLDLEPITVARLIDRLEAAGLVERRRCADDRRAHRLFLQPAAEPVIAGIRAEADTILKDALAGFSDLQVGALHDALGALRDNLLAHEQASQTTEL
jgi:MarR family transcriptional regulator, transcriptional regulator for hemolysin